MTHTAVYPSNPPDHEDETVNVVRLFFEQNYAEFRAYVKKILDENLLPQDKAWAEIYRDSSVVRRWIAQGAFPRGIDFGYKEKFWLRSEIDTMKQAIRDELSLLDRQKLVTRMHTSRIRILSWVLQGAADPRRHSTVLELIERHLP